MPPATRATGNKARAKPAAKRPTSANTEQLLGELLASQEANRKEMADLRAELAAAKKAAPPAATVTLNPEQQRQARLTELAAHEFYCPGCGQTYDYPQKCGGRPEAPHPAIEVVSTKEVQGAPDPSDKDATVRWESNHTAAPAAL